MATVPRFQRSQSIPAQSTGVRANPAAFGGGGAGLRALGATGVALTDDLDRLRRRERELEARRLQKLADANFKTEQSGAVTEDLLVEFNSRRRAGDPTDPAYTQDFDDFAKKRIKEVKNAVPKLPSGEASVSPEAQAALAEKLKTLRLRLFERNLGIQRDAGDAKALDNIKANGNQISALARRNPAGLAPALSAIDGLIGDFDGVLSANMLRDQKSALRAEAIAENIRGFIDRGDFAMAEKLATSADFDIDLSAQLRDRLFGEVSAARTAGAARARGLVTDVAGVLEAGEVPPPDLLAAAQTAAAPFPKLTERLAKAARLGNFSRQLRLQRPAVTQTVINQMRGKGTKTSEDLDRLRVAETILADTTRELEKDALSYGARVGLVTVSPMDPSKPETIRARIDAARIISDHFDADALPFTDEEIDVIVKRYEGADATARLATIDSFTKIGLPQDMVDGMLAKIEDKDPSMGLIAALAGSDPVSARKILIGQEFIKNNPTSVPKSADTGPVIESTLGDALRADQTGRARAAILSAANAFYVQGRIGEGPEFDKDAYQNALTAAAGTVVERNGQNTILPPGVSEDQFETRLEALTNGALHPPLGAGAGEVVSDVPVGPHRLTSKGLVEIEAAEILDNGRLIAVGPGRYMVGFAQDRPGLGTGDDLKFAVDGNGDPYVLDLSRPPPPRPPNTAAIPDSVIGAGGGG